MFVGDTPDCWKTFVYIKGELCGHFQHSTMFWNECTIEEQRGGNLGIPGNDLYKQNSATTKPLDSDHVFIRATESTSSSFSAVFAS